MNPLYVAVLNEHAIEDIKHRIEQNKEWVNERNACCGGFTALHCVVSKACHHNGVSIPVLQLLLDAGADLEIGDNLSYTPLHAACIASGKNRDILHVELLLKAGASVKRPNNARESPLHLALLNENAALVQLLLEFGADIHEKDYTGRSCLDYVPPDSELYHVMISFGESEIKEPDSHA